MTKTNILCHKLLKYVPQNLSGLGIKCINQILRTQKIKLPVGREEEYGIWDGVVPGVGLGTLVLI